MLLIIRTRTQGARRSVNWTIANSAYFAKLNGAPTTASAIIASTIGTIQKVPSIRTLAVKLKLAQIHVFMRTARLVLTVANVGYRTALTPALSLSTATFGSWKKANSGTVTLALRRPPLWKKFTRRRSNAETTSMPRSLRWKRITAPAVSVL